jgi:membrane fusion protein, multidrug efflux system
VSTPELKLQDKPPQIAVRQSLLSDYRTLTLLALLIGLGVFGSYVFLNRHIEKTDNAIVRCDISDIVSEERGIIKAIHFSDNQTVQRDAPLIEMDQDMFLASRHRAAAALASAEVMQEGARQSKALAEIDAQALIQKSKASAEASELKMKASDYEVKQVGTELLMAKTKLDAEDSNLQRARQLHAQNFVSEKNLTDAQTNSALASATLQGMQAKLSLIRTRRGSEHALTDEARTTYQQAKQSLLSKQAAAEAAVQTSVRQVEIAKAELALADIKLARTQIKARRLGEVTNRRVAVGEHVEVGQPIASITSCASKAWIEANFKETQIENMQPGQAVTVKLDGYRSHVFQGRVESLSNGSGSMFSVLPPENATGNFTKVVQRFPVKIHLDPVPGVELRVGMSALVSVDVGRQMMAPALGP